MVSNAGSSGFSCVTRFDSGDITAQEFWADLCDLANDGIISRDEKRELFWNSHSWTKQRYLSALCPHFDPHDYVWNEEVREDYKTLAMGLLSEVMAVDVEKRISAERKNCWGFGLAGTWFGLAGVALCGMLAIPDIGSAKGCFIGLAVFMYILALVCDTALWFNFFKLRKFKRLRESWSAGIKNHITPSSSSHCSTGTE